MKPKKSATFQITVQGRRWKYTVLTPARYTAQEDDSRAITYPDKRHMYFNSEDLTVGVCVHELFHAFCTTLYTASANLSPIQFEEIIAEWAEVHLQEWAQKAEVMFNKMKNSGVQ